jgi:hypothetical protein
MTTQASATRRRLALVVTALATAFAVILIARRLSGPMAWPLAAPGFDRAPSDYLSAYLWPAAILSLFALAVLPAVLPASLAASASLRATSRIALLVGIVLSLMLLIGLVTTPIL